MPSYRSTYNNSIALLIGINDYSDPRFSELHFAESDARAFAKLLEASPYNFKTNCLIGAAATKVAIQKALNSLRRTQTDDCIIVYFAGHGYKVPDRLGKETGFLACVDTDPDNDYTALNLDELLTLGRHSPAKHIGYILDACYMGEALNYTRSSTIVSEKLMQISARQVLSAGTAKQTVTDPDSMTQYIIKALEGDMLMTEGLITLNQLGMHVRQAMLKDRDKSQIPQFGHISGSEGGDLVFYVDANERLPREIEDALRSPYADIRRGGIRELIKIAKTPEHLLTNVALSRLHQIAEHDPDERVRNAAESHLTWVENEKRIAEIKAQQDELANKTDKFLEDNDEPVDPPSKSTPSDPIVTARQSAIPNWLSARIKSIPALAWVGMIWAGFGWGLSWWPYIYGKRILGIEDYLLTGTDKVNFAINRMYSMIIPVLVAGLVVGVITRLITRDGKRATITGSAVTLGTTAAPFITELIRYLHWNRMGSPRPELPAWFYREIGFSINGLTETFFGGLLIGLFLILLTGLLRRDWRTGGKAALGWIVGGSLSALVIALVPYKGTYYKTEVLICLIVMGMISTLIMYAWAYRESVMRGKEQYV